MNKKTVSFYTLGCKVNQYETQMLKEKFSDAGYEIAGEEEYADVYIINTCTVTNLSDRKSRQHIRRMKKINPDAVIAVTGCYAQTDPEAAAAVEGVCIVAGTNEKNNLVEFVENYIRENGDSRYAVDSHIIPYEELTEYEETGIITSMESRTRAYIKVQEGCDRFCSYCIIPYARGKVRSRGLREVLAEAESLISRGFRELVLTGINTALYGIDFEEWKDDSISGIEKLIAAIDGLEGDFRIRLSSLEPNVIDLSVAENLHKYRKLCPHIHLSIQSGSDSVLKRMNRIYNREEYLAIANKLKETEPLYAITTDIIVGFPGETDEEFEDSIDMISRVGFSKVHAFKYSKRNGTVAAEMKNQVDGVIKNKRSEILISHAEEAATEFCKKNIGSIRRVLFERMTDEGLIEGYTDNYIRVYCETSDSESLLDSFADVKLESLYKDGLKGTVVQ